MSDFAFRHVLKSKNEERKKFLEFKKLVSDWIDGLDIQNVHHYNCDIMDYGKRAVCTCNFDKIERIMNGRD